ncbi:folate/biopterin transporter subfamily protein [Besnoitia besnoiti]|uniref:Folate/biopterin transporter subfamily protein n=1 Tax=Besnoitia besnoiti TaxID=94643 RepID=A0A2A9MJB0_BESBE|nr:folate/biopterin transporter subfamily protein [Besnoitia besnoiti]PFH37999.1 folate/biopterin transporter subfamily protein [Besnoitia besnoiti]
MATWRSHRASEERRPSSLPFPRSSYLSAPGLEGPLSPSPSSCSTAAAAPSPRSERGQKSFASGACAPASAPPAPPPLLAAASPAHDESARVPGWCRRLSRLSPARLWDFVKGVKQETGLHFTLLMLSTYVGLKGFLYIMATDSLLPYMKALGYDGLVYQRTLTLAYVPWGMKGLIGSLSDALPIAGYHKRAYMLLASLAGVSSLVCLLFLSDWTAHHAAWVVGVLFFGVHLQIATVDLMCEGMYSQVMAARPHVGGNLVTFVNACTTVGAFLGRLVVGPVSDRFGAHPLFLLALPVALQSLLPVGLNYLHEERVSPGCALLTDKVREQKKVFFVAVAVAACASGVAAISLLGDKNMTYILPYCGCASLALIVLCVVCLPPQLAKCNIFFFADRILHISISGALDFFYTAAPACVPDGPHFDYTYYSTYTAMAGTLATWVGLVFFQVALSSWSYRSIFWLTSAVRILASLFDYVLATRLNLRLGIPDKLMYLLGDAIILSVIGALSHMAGVILTSRLCPRHMESTVYAILAGISNFGHSVSILLGIRAIKAANITTTAREGDACNFENLPILIILAHCLLPMLSVPLALFLLPGTPMDEPLDDCDAGGFCGRRADRDPNKRGAAPEEAAGLPGSDERPETRRRKKGRAESHPTPCSETELIAVPAGRGNRAKGARSQHRLGHYAIPTEDYADEDEEEVAGQPAAFFATEGRLPEASAGAGGRGREAERQRGAAAGVPFATLPALGPDREDRSMPDAIGVSAFLPLPRRDSDWSAEAPEEQRVDIAPPGRRRSRGARGCQGGGDSACSSEEASDSVHTSASSFLAASSEAEKDAERGGRRGGAAASRDAAGRGTSLCHAAAVEHSCAPPRGESPVPRESSPFSTRSTGAEGASQVLVLGDDVSVLDLLSAADEEVGRVCVGPDATTAASLAVAEATDIMYKLTAGLPAPSHATPDSRSTDTPPTRASFAASSATNSDIDLYSPATLVTPGRSTPSPSSGSLSLLSAHVLLPAESSAATSAVAASSASPASSSFPSSFHSASSSSAGGTTSACGSARGRSVRAPSDERELEIPLAAGSECGNGSGSGAARERGASASLPCAATRGGQSPSEGGGAPAVVHSAFGAGRAPVTLAGFPQWTSRGGPAVEETRPQIVGCSVEQREESLESAQWRRSPRRK